MPIRRLMLLPVLVLAAACGVGDAGAGDAVDRVAADLGRDLAGDGDPKVAVREAGAHVLDTSSDEELVVRISRTVDGGSWKGEHTAVHCYSYDLADPAPERIDCTGAVALDAQTFTTVVRD